MNQIKLLEATQGKPVFRHRHHAAELGEFFGNLLGVLLFFLLLGVDWAELIMRAVQ